MLLSVFSFFHVFLKTDINKNTQKVADKTRNYLDSNISPSSGTIIYWLQELKKIKKTFIPHSIIPNPNWNWWMSVQCLCGMWVGFVSKRDLASPPVLLLLSERLVEAAGNGEMLSLSSGTEIRAQLTKMNDPVSRPRIPGSTSLAI